MSQSSLIPAAQTPTQLIPTSFQGFEEASDTAQLSKNFPHNQLNFVGDSAHKVSDAAQTPNLNFTPQRDTGNVQHGQDVPPSPMPNAPESPKNYHMSEGDQDPKEEIHQKQAEYEEKKITSASLVRIPLDGMDDE